MAPVHKPLLQYPSLFELEEIGRLISKTIHFENIFQGFRYRFLFDNLRSGKFGNFKIEILPDDQLVAAASVDFKTRTLRIKASIHSAGLKGLAHPLMVLVHEVVHILLKHKGTRNKIPGIDIRELNDPDEKLQEWITNRVAGAVLMPYAQTLHCRRLSENDLCKLFFVTKDAAYFRLRQINAMRQAKPPEFVIARRPESPKRFRDALEDYETKTNGKLGTLERIRNATKGYMLQACENCHSSSCLIDETNFTCDGCGEAVDPQNVTSVRLPKN